MTWERIPTSAWEEQAGHVYRYDLAGSLLRAGDVVLDAACGIGYGAKVMARHVPITYCGVDRAEAIDPEFLPYGWFTAADLDAWRPSIGFDVAICFETLEHLSEPARLARVLCQARRLAVVSVPTVPTKHMNEFHLHDFTVESLLKLFPSYDSVEVIPQPEELSHIFIFRMAPDEV